MLKTKMHSFKTKKLSAIIIFFIFLFILHTPLYEVKISVFNPILRKLEGQVVAYRTSNYKELETDHFIIRYRNIEPEILDLVARTSEDKYEKVVEAFQYEIGQKILLIIYDDPSEMLAITTLRQETYPMGVYYGNSVHILKPTLWVEEHEDIEYMFSKEGPVLHELVHLFTDHLAKGNFPMWFTEGVSLYFEYWIDGYEWGREVDFLQEDFTIKDLTEEFDILDPYKKYTKSFRIIKDFVEKNGIHNLIHMIESLGHGAKFEEFIYLFE